MFTQIFHFLPLTRNPVAFPFTAVAKEGTLRQVCFKESFMFQYFPPTLYVWLAYCSSFIAVFGTIKCVNHALHCVYDTTECLEEPNQTISQQKSEGEKKWAGTHNKSREQSQDQTGHGIELQVLNGMLHSI